MGITGWFDSERLLRPVQRESLLAFNNFCGILNETFRESMLSRHSYFLPSVIAHYPSFQKNKNTYSLSSSSFFSSWHHIWLIWRYIQEWLMLLTLYVLPIGRIHSCRPLIKRYCHSRYIQLSRCCCCCWDCRTWKRRFFSPYWAKGSQRAF